MFHNLGVHIPPWMSSPWPCQDHELIRLDDHFVCRRDRLAFDHVYDDLSQPHVAEASSFESLFRIRKVGQDQHAVVVVIAEVAEDVIVTGLDNFRACPCKGQVLLSQLNQSQESLVNPTRNAIRVTTLLGTLPVEGRRGVASECPPLSLARSRSRSRSAWRSRRPGRSAGCRRWS